MNIYCATSHKYSGYIFSSYAKLIQLLVSFKIEINDRCIIWNISQITVVISFKGIDKIFTLLFNISETEVYVVYIARVLFDYEINARTTTLCKFSYALITRAESTSLIHILTFSLITMLFNFWSPNRSFNKNIGTMLLSLAVCKFRVFQIKPEKKEAASVHFLCSQINSNKYTDLEWYFASARNKGGQ